MRIRRTRAAIVVAAFTAFMLLTTTLAGAGTSTGRPAGDTESGGRCHAGAPGVGDDYYPLYGNGGYDVRHYLLKVSYDPATDRLVGVATILARATENLCRFNLDLQGLTVRSVTVNGKRARWSRSQDHELTITPRHKLHKGQRFTTIVRYDGVPRTQQISFGPDFTLEAGFIHTDDGAVIAGEPEVAANWFPVNDHPIDKAAYTFVVTVPAGLEVVANGRLLGRRTRHGKTTWIWNAPEPMASYLATATMGQFDLRRYRTADGLRMYDAFDPDLFSEPSNPDDPASPTYGEIAEGSFARQGEILDFLASKFGPYPFSTGGGIVDDYDNLFFALENQTRTVYSKYFFTDPISGDFVVVHENAHQWYGDSVAVAEWKHIWLNEGFATYAEWLWSEHEGLGTTQEIFDALYNDIPADDPFWDVVIGDPGVELLFDNAVYVRGAMTLQALRNEVGDRDFFRILRAWAQRKAGGNGTTAQFIALAERLSGEQLDWLFDAWLFTAGKPALATSTAAGALAEAPATAASARGRRRQRPACSSAARPERPGDGDRSSGGGRVVPDAGGGGGAGVVGGGPHRLHAPAPSSAAGHTGRMDATEAWPPPDPVGEARHFLRMDGAFYCRSELRAPWGMTLHPMPGYLWFHVVTTGVLLLEVDQEHARWLHPGDVALGSRGNGHVLRSEPGVSALGILELALEHPSDRYEILRHGGGGAPTTPPRPQDRGRHRGRAVRPARLPVRGRARARLQTRHRRPPRRRQTRPRTAAGRGRRR